MFDGAYSGRRVIVTGHTGFKGSWLSVWLGKLGAELYGISRDVPTRPSMFEELQLHNQMRDIRLDIRDTDRLSSTVREIQPHFVFHLAAMAIVSEAYMEPIEAISTNVMGTANILNALRNCSEDCSTVIITSDKCYDNVEWSWGYRETDVLGGKDIYGGSKAAAELVFKSFSHSYFNDETQPVRVVSARAGNVVGGGDWARDRIVPDCVRAWNEDRDVRIRSPLATRPWQHVLEPLSGYLLLGAELSRRRELCGESYNFGPKSHESKTVQDLLHDLRTVWAPAEHGAGFRASDEETFHEARLLRLNCEKALSELNWIATLDYAHTVQFTGDWYREYYRGDTTRMHEVTVRQLSEYERIARDRGTPWAAQ